MRAPASRYSWAARKWSVASASRSDSSKKIFVWKTGFWGGRAYGWHYDLMLVVMNLVIVTTGGGKLVIL